MEKRYFEYNGEKYFAYSVNLLDIYSDQKEDLYTFEEFVKYLCSCVK